MIPKEKIKQSLIDKYGKLRDGNNYKITIDGKDFDIWIDGNRIVDMNSSGNIIGIL